MAITRSISYNLHILHGNKTKLNIQDDDDNDDDYDDYDDNENQKWL